MGELTIELTTSACDVACALPQHVVGEQYPEFVACQRAQRPVSIARAHREPVGIRIIRERQVRVQGLGECRHAIHRTGLLRVRKRHGRKCRVGLGLFGDALDRESRAVQRCASEALSDPVEGRVRDPAVAIARPVGRLRLRSLAGSALRVRARSRARAAPRAELQRPRAATRAPKRLRSSLAAIARSCGGRSWAPFSQYTLYPLSLAGL